MKPLFTEIYPANQPNTHSAFIGREPPRLRYAGTVKCRTGESFHHPLHNDPLVTEIELVLEGQQDLLIDGKHYRVVAGDIFFLNQAIWHEEKTVPDQPFRAVYINFAGLEMNGLPIGFFVSRRLSPVHALGDRLFKIERRFDDVIRACSERGHESARVADLLLAVLLSDIAEAVYVQKGTVEEHARNASATIIAAQRYIHANYDQTLSLASIGDAANVSRFHICRVFRAETGYTPIEYLLKYRIEVAKEILRSTDDTVAVIAERVGYQSETHFQNVFRRTVGISPGRYRRARRAELEQVD